MTSERLNQYFAGEAEDYLGEIDSLLAGYERPDPERFVRLAAGIRGSTRMAGADAISRLAGRLEEAARSLHDSRLVWTDDVRSLARDTVGEIRDLIAALGRWGPEEEQRIDTAIWRWQDALGTDWLDPRPVVPIDTLYFDDAGPHVFDPEPIPGEVSRTAVPIESLLLRGEAALQGALALKPAFEAVVRGDAVPERPLPELVAELFDLLELGLNSAQEA